MPRDTAALKGPDAGVNPASSDGAVAPPAGAGSSADLAAAKSVAAGVLV